MLITTYTTYAEVRAVCGINQFDLPDTELALEVYANSLEYRMSTVTLPTDAPGPGPLDSRFVTIAAIAEVSRTAAQQKLYILTRLFATYAVAEDVMKSISLRTPKSESDGKRTQTRFSAEATFRDVVDNIRSMLGSVKEAIENINETAIGVMPILSVITPATNVVTNE